MLDPKLIAQLAAKSVAKTSLKAILADSTSPSSRAAFGIQPRTETNAELPIRNIGNEQGRPWSIPMPQTLPDISRWPGVTEDAGKFRPLPLDPKLEYKPVPFPYYPKPGDGPEFDLTYRPKRTEIDDILKDWYGKESRGAVKSVATPLADWRDKLYNLPDNEKQDPLTLTIYKDWYEDTAAPLNMAWPKDASELNLSIQPLVYNQSRDSANSLATDFGMFEQFSNKSLDASSAVKSKNYTEASRLFKETESKLDESLALIHSIDLTDGDILGARTDAVELYEALVDTMTALERQLSIDGMVDEKTLRDARFAAGKAYKAADDALNMIYKTVPSVMYEYDWQKEGMRSTPLVTNEFLSKTAEVAKKLEMNPDDLMALMAFESWFDPSIKSATSSATGLIQFMPSTARRLGTTTEELSKMTAVEQLDYVYKYLEPYKGRLNDLGDAYLVVLSGGIGIGKSDDYVIWRSGTPEYAANSGLDRGNKGYITRGDALRAVLGRREEFGLKS